MVVDCLPVISSYSPALKLEAIRTCETSVQTRTTWCYFPEDNILHFITSLFFMMSYPHAKPQAQGPPLVGCPRLLIQYIHSYPPYLESVSSVCNLRTHYAMVTRDPPNMAHEN
jgi:hypothetical protein